MKLMEIFKFFILSCLCLYLFSGCNKTRNPDFTDGKPTVFAITMYSSNSGDIVNIFNSEGFHVYERTQVISFKDIDTGMEYYISPPYSIENITNRYWKANAQKLR